MLFRSNGVLDAGEASAVTNALGQYTLAKGTGKLIAIGGVDTQSGAAITQLIAPDGYSVITPLTTLVAAGADLSSLLPAGMTAAQLATYDPQAALSSTTTRDQAAQLMASGQQVLAVLNTATALVSQVGNVSQSAALTTAVTQFAAATKTGGFSVTNANSVGTVLTGALAGTGADNNLINAAKTVLSNSVSMITANAVKDGSNVALARLTQTSMVADLKTLAAASPAEVAAQAAAIQTKYTTDLTATLKADTAAVAAIQSAKIAAASGLVLKADTYTTTAASLYDASVNVLANDSKIGRAHV